MKPYTLESRDPDQLMQQSRRKGIYEFVLGGETQTQLLKRFGFNLTRILPHGSSSSTRLV
jgi:hypothetical protein